MNKTLVGQLDIADKICREASFHLANADEYMKKAQKEYSKENTRQFYARFLGAILMYCIILFVLGRIALVFNNVDQVNAFINKHLLPVMFIIIALSFAISSVITKILFTHRKSDELKILHAEEQAAASKIFIDHKLDLEFLPDEYWYPLATEYLLRVAKTDRADTINEALAMFDEQQHRWKVEAALNVMLQQQQLQIAQLNSIRRSIGFIN